MLVKKIFYMQVVSLYGRGVGQRRRAHLSEYLGLDGLELQNKIHAANTNIIGIRLDDVSNDDGESKFSENTISAQIEFTSAILLFLWSHQKTSCDYAQ